MAYVGESLDPTQAERLEASPAVVDGMRLNPKTAVGKTVKSRIDYLASLGVPASTTLKKLAEKETVPIKLSWKQVAAERFPDDQFETSADFYVRLGHEVAKATVELDVKNLVVSDEGVDPLVLVTGTVASQIASEATESTLRSIGYSLGSRAHLADGGSDNTRNLEALLATLDYQQQPIDET